jgi:hypothetical protein
LHSVGIVHWLGVQLVPAVLTAVATTIAIQVFHHVARAAAARLADRNLVRRAWT